MKRSKFKENWLGYRYIVNHRSKEIHRVSTITRQCRISMLVRSEYCRKSKMRQYLAMGYNGCSKCFEEEDNG